MIHQSVLLQESINGLEIKKGDIFVDGTLGNGGHCEEVLKRFGKDVKIFAFDLDEDAIERSKKRLSVYGGDITYINANFKDMVDVLKDLGLSAVDKVLLDIGLSSNQLEESGRGFTFSKNEPLFMTFSRDKKDSFDAYDMVNFWDEDILRTIIRQYGEERFAGRIASGIVKTRKLSEIKTTEDLVNIILANTPKFYHYGKIHPATKTFQALRIAVNDELTNLSSGIESIFSFLSVGGRLAVISFHSLEDRIVKKYFKSLQEQVLAKKITKKPITSKEEEVNLNKRSRSAKLRILEKL
jgi:16S rRNA (cytosine1402-N4)-methyltransferase